jgi:hypothetical protein
MAKVFSILNLHTKYCFDKNNLSMGLEVFRLVGGLNTQERI